MPIRFNISGSIPLPTKESLYPRWVQKMPLTSRKLNSIIDITTTYNNSVTKTYSIIMISGFVQLDIAAEILYNLITLKGWLCDKG